MPEPHRNLLIHHPEGIHEEFKEPSSVDIDASDRGLHKLARTLRRWGVETRGIQPVSLQARTDTQYNQIFFIFLSGNLNITTFSIGILAPIYGFGLRDACLVILVFNLIFNAFPAYFCTWGPKFGLRQMVLGRYSFGFYGIALPCILNLMTMTCYAALSCIVGGQTLSAVSDHALDPSLGILIIALVSLVVSFCGYRVLSWFDRLAWAPIFIVSLVILGVGGKFLGADQVPQTATIQSVFNFGAPIGSAIAWSTFSSDMTCYFSPNVSSTRIFIYSYLGLILPSISMQILGAAFSIAATTVPAWQIAFGHANVGGLIAAILHPTGNFGKFLVTLLALGVIANISMNLYCFCLNVQVLIPYLARFPRYLFSLVAIGIVIPVAIAGSHGFAQTLSNLLGIIGYWSSPFVAIMLTEHFIFRRGNRHHYDLSHWDSPGGLPTGLPALVALAIGTGMGVMCMNQAWFVGPVAKFTSDIGLEVPLAVGFLVYLPLRRLEINWWGDMRKLPLESVLTASSK